MGLHVLRRFTTSACRRGVIRPSSSVSGGTTTRRPDQFDAAPHDFFLKVKHRVVTTRLIAAASLINMRRDSTCRGKHEAAQDDAWNQAATLAFGSKNTDLIWALSQTIQVFYGIVTPADNADSYRAYTRCISQKVRIMSRQTWHATMSVSWHAGGTRLRPNPQPTSKQRRRCPHVCQSDMQAS